MCYLIRCYLACPHEKGHWPASVWGHYKPSPSLSMFCSPPHHPSLSVLPMNVSISLPMCKLFSPALRADGEPRLCRDFLCMSFLISQRVTRFPCSSQEQGELARSCAHTLHTRANTRSQSAINMHAASWGILAQRRQGRGSLHQLTFQDHDGLILQRRPGPTLILASAIPHFSSN